MSETAPKFHVEHRCAPCGGTREAQRAFCRGCWARLPHELKAALRGNLRRPREQRAIVVRRCLEWFRAHRPAPAAAPQPDLFPANA